VIGPHRVIVTASGEEETESEDGQQYRTQGSAHCARSFQQESDDAARGGAPPVQVNGRFNNA
jgi:hypothetical protein